MEERRFVLGCKVAGSYVKDTGELGRRETDRIREVAVPRYENSILASRTLDDLLVVRGGEADVNGVHGVVSVGPEGDGAAPTHALVEQESHRGVTFSVAKYAA